MLAECLWRPNNGCEHSSIQLSTHEMKSTLANSGDYMLVFIAQNIVLVLPVFVVSVAINKRHYF